MKEFLEQFICLQFLSFEGSSQKRDIARMERQLDHSFSSLLDFLRAQVIVKNGCTSRDFFHQCLKIGYIIHVLCHIRSKNALLHALLKQVELVRCQTIK